MKREILESLALIYVKKNLVAGASPTEVLAIYEKAIKEMQNSLPHWETNG